jgi:hypothetical protein
MDIIFLVRLRTIIMCSSRSPNDRKMEPIAEEVRFVSNLLSYRMQRLPVSSSAEQQGAI